VFDWSLDEGPDPCWVARVLAPMGWTIEKAIGAELCGAISDG
jgi:hypothetical protein